MIQSKPCRPNMDGEICSHTEGFRFKALLFDDAARIYGGEDQRGKTKRKPCKTEIKPQNTQANR